MWPPMTKLQISAVITAYNSETFVAGAISSVLEQTYPVDEIVVVDDGSTDNTAEIAQRFNANLIRTENQGLSAARNTGLEAFDEPGVMIFSSLHKEFGWKTRAKFCSLSDRER